MDFRKFFHNSLLVTEVLWLPTLTPMSGCCYCSSLLRTALCLPGTFSLVQRRGQLAGSVYMCAPWRLCVRVVLSWGSSFIPQHNIPHTVFSPSFSFSLLYAFYLTNTHTLTPTSTLPLKFSRCTFWYKAISGQPLQLLLSQMEHLRHLKRIFAK